MKWSWKMGRIAGIDVYIHATFLLIIGWVVLSHWQQGVAGIVVGVVFILAIFACVVLHEFGHALTAGKFGIKTRDITLYPIGGVARLERMPDKPLQELTVTTGPFLERLLVVNLFLVGFNLLPAFPMDGGRVLRALMALRMEYTRATQVAATIGQGMALLFGFLGIFGNPMLLFIALVVWMGAAGEASMVQMKSSLAGIPISHAMVTDFRMLGPRDTLARAVELILQGAQQDFPVLEDGRIVGVLTRAALLPALAQRGQSTPVEEIMQREFQFADSAEMLETAFQRLQTCECHTIPVTHEGRLVGLVTSENVGEFLMIQAALKERAASTPIPPSLPTSA